MARTKIEEIETTSKVTNVPKKRDYIGSTGRRKTAVARVRLYKKGEGKISVNNKEYAEYFPYFEMKDIITAPLKACGMGEDLNFTIKVAGGGKKSQAEAVRHGIARTLILLDENLRSTLKPLGFLKRDSRKKERKKPGLKRARRAPQWQKR